MACRDSRLVCFVSAALACVVFAGCKPHKSAKVERPLLDAATAPATTPENDAGNESRREGSIDKGSAVEAKSDTASEAVAASTPRESQDVQAPPIDELLLFFPSKYPAGDWAPAELQFEDVWFSSADGTRLHGWHCTCANPRATVLIAHGNAGHVASRAPWLAYLQSRARVATFLFDYRGYGRSEGAPTVRGAIADAKAARAKLRELSGVSDSEMVLMGESLGGAIVVQLAAESPPRGLVLQSTFSSLRDVADFHFPKLAWLVPPEKLDSAASIASYRGPLLVSHGTADGTIPFGLGEKLFRTANEPKTFVAIPDADHNDWLTEEYLARLDLFLNSLDTASHR
jgi:fermentation-respiration switch protein FrsA (DUF1100 family)